MDPFNIKLIDSQYYVTCSFSPKILGPFPTKEEAALEIRDYYDACHLCGFNLDGYGRCGDCGSTGEELLQN